MPVLDLSTADIIYLLTQDGYVCFKIRGVDYARTNKSIKNVVDRSKIPLETTFDIYLKEKLELAGTGEKGDGGDKGDQGLPGESDLILSDSVLEYESGLLVGIEYADGQSKDILYNIDETIHQVIWHRLADTVTKTFAYTGDDITSIDVEVT